MSGSGYKSFSAGSVLTASDVNGYLMKQSIMYFASTSARDSALTSPEDGMVCYINSNDSSEGLYTYNGTSWRKGPGWNAPWGFIGKTELSADTTNITTVTDVTGGSVTFTAVANRYYRIEGWVYFVNGANPSAALLSIKEGSTVLTRAGGAYQPAYVGNHLYATRITTFTAGSHTLKLTAELLSGSGPIATSVSSERPDFISVIDVGPSGAPA